jgi:polar amino acid transport system substrate-binding protein
LKSAGLKGRISVIPMPEATPRFTGVYLSKKTMSTEVRQRYAMALKTMVTDQVLPGLYAKYFDDATVKRTFKQGSGPLLTALSAPD